MTDGTSVAWVLLFPNDVVTFRDGRPFAPGVAATGRTTMPRPSSVSGAIGALFGPAARPDRLLGPVLVRAGGGRSPQVLLPTPADVVVDEDDGRVTLLRPPGVPGTGAEAAPGFPAGLTTDLRAGSGSDTGSSAGAGAGRRVRLLGGDGKPPDGLVDASLVGTYLNGDADALLDAVADGAVEKALMREARLGIARQPRAAAGSGRVTVPGFLYQEEFWRPVTETVEGPDGSTSGLAFASRVAFKDVVFKDKDEVPTPGSVMVRLGGEARQAEAVVVPDGHPTAPALPPRADVSDGRVLLYLATLAVFADGWHPPLPAGCELVAACTSGPEIVTGISGDTGRGRPLRWAVGAGSVYFLRFGDPDDATTYAEATHGECLGQAEDWMRTAGFGACLVGRW